ncbi:type IV pilus assembly protein PilE [Elusimicrobium simillimum]|uniref:type IV pilin protein n=1 Tax=Elusimicrobium simillimum TaxID=3143438 RepID=UPI003C6FD74A
MKIFQRRSIINAAGFTLIELLVVVLIIGILAAIALPQYTKAVEKSRMAEAAIVIKNLGDSLERYILAEGAFPTKSPLITDLDIDIPGTFTEEITLNTIKGKNFYYSVSCTSAWCYVSASKRDKDAKLQYTLSMQIFSDGSAPSKACGYCGKNLCPIAKDVGFTDTRKIICI